MSSLALLVPAALALPPTIATALPAPPAAVEVKGPERKALIAEDIARLAEGPGPVRMAVGRPVSGDLQTLGTWSTLPDGRRAWQAVFRAATAEHLSLSFPEATLPVGAGSLIAGAAVALLTRSTAAALLLGTAVPEGAG